MLDFLRKQMKWVMAIIVVAFLLSTFLMYEGRSTRRTPGRNPDGSMSDYEVAQINGRSLMRSELERRLRDYLSTYSSRSAESLDMAAIYRTVLDQVILDSQMAKEVEEKGIRVSDAEADRAMKDYADRYYPTRETFYQALANSGVKVEDYKKSLARQMAMEQLILGAVGEVVVSEDQAVQFYDTMKGLFYTTPESYKVHMADFRTSADAEFMRAKLVAGESWETIVSNDELASRDVINITREPVSLPATAFAYGTMRTLASLDVGVPSEVFSATSTDYAVGMKTEHVEASVRPYAEVSGDIKNMMRQQEQSRRLTEYQNALLGRAQVVINDEELFARPVVSEDKPVVVEEVIPELAEAPVSAEAEAKPAAEETQPAEVETLVIDETPETEAETPAVDPAKVAEGEALDAKEDASAVVNVLSADTTPDAEAETETPAVDPAKVAEGEALDAKEDASAVVNVLSADTTPDAETPVTEEPKPAETTDSHTLKITLIVPSEDKQQ